MISAMMLKASTKRHSEWRMANGEWRMGVGDWRLEIGEFVSVIGASL
jgi:hypothetical protein